jgi:hypothetical protein
MNLLDLYEGREPHQQAIDKLEQRRIEDLEAKMDDFARRGMKDEFLKCKEERDSYYRVKNEGYDSPLDTPAAVAAREKLAKAMAPVKKQHPDHPALRNFKSDVELDEKLGANRPKLGSARDVGKSVKKFRAQRGLDEAGDRVDPILIKALSRMPDGLASHHEVLDAAYDAYAMELGRMHMKSNYGVTNAYIPQLMDLYKEKHGLTFNEAGIGQDLVTPQQRVQQSQPQKQTPLQKVGSTVKQAAKWVAGQGGPGKEGPTYESDELDEQESSLFDAVSGRNLVLLQQAWEKQLPNVSLEFPGQNVTVYLPQVYSIFAHLQKMNNNKQVETVQKFFGNRQDFLMWMNSIKQLQIPAKVQKSVKSNFAQPEPGQLDLGIKEAKKKDSLTTPGSESDVAIKLARNRFPSAKSDLEAVVKDKIETDKTTKAELDQLKTDNEKQEREISDLRGETDALNIATSQQTPAKTSARAPATTQKPTVAVNPTMPTTVAPAAGDIPTMPVQYTATAPADEVPAVMPEPASTNGVAVKDKVDAPTKINYKPVNKNRLGRRQTPALPGKEQPKNMGTVNLAPKIDRGLDNVQAASQSNRQQRFKKSQPVSIVPGNFELVEGQMRELDAMRQDLERMNERQFYTAYGISKAAFQQKYRSLLKPANLGYTNENVDDDWEDDEGDYINDPQVYAQVKNTTLPDQVLQAIQRNPAMRADIIADYKRKQGMDEGFQDFNKVEPYAVCLAGKPVKKFDYYEEARRFHDNWKQKLYREGDKAKADKITLMPLNLDETYQYPSNPEAVAKQKATINRPASTSTDKVKTFAAQGYTIKFKPDVVEIYHGANLVYSKPGNFSNPTRAQLGAIRGRVTDLVNRKKKEMAEAGSPAQQAAIAIAMKKAGKKPKQVDEDDPNGGATIAIGQTDGAPADEIPTYEAQTDYSKRRQRERDIDAGKPVKSLPKNPQTDYAKKRAKEKRDLDLFGEGSYMESVKQSGITDNKLLEAAAKIDQFAKSFK